MTRGTTDAASIAVGMDPVPAQAWNPSIPRLPSQEFTEIVQAPHCGLHCKPRVVAFQPIPGKLIIGEASTQLNLGRQEKVVEQYGILSAAHHTVVPALFGTQRNRTVIDLPNLVAVRIEQNRFRQAGEDPDFGLDDAYRQFAAALDRLLVGASPSSTRDT